VATRYHLAVALLVKLCLLMRKKIIVALANNFFLALAQKMAKCGVGELKLQLPIFKSKKVRGAGKYGIEQLTVLPVLLFFLLQLPKEGCIRAG